jgi:hypothetical protein
LCIAGIFLLFHLPLLGSSVASLLLASIRAPWVSPGEMTASFLLGAAGAIVIWIIKRRVRSRVVEELVGATISTDTVTALKIGRMEAVLSILIGVFSSIVVDRLDVLGVHSGATSELGMLLSAGGGGGGAGAGGGDLFVILVAVVIVVILLTMLGAVGISAVLSAAAKGMLGGAAEGAGRATGIAIMLTLTRLGTTLVTDQGRRGKAGRLTLAAACEEFIASSSAGADAQERRAVVEPYLDWLRRLDIEPDAPALARHVEVYCRQSKRRREFEDHLAKTANLAREPGQPGWEREKPMRVARGVARDAAEREVRILGELAAAVPSRMREQDPTLRMSTTDGAPVFDGTLATLLHARWFSAGLRTCVREGVLVGALVGIISVAFRTLGILTAN